MNANVPNGRLLELATELNHALEDKTGINIRLTNQRRDLEARQLNLIPAEGWPGKNSEERKINEQRTYANDGICHAIQVQINSLEEALALVETVLETYVNTRRAMEWEIKAKRLDLRRFEFGLVDKVDRDEFDDDVLDDQEDEALDELAEWQREQKATENGHHFEPYPPEDDPLYLAINMPREEPALSGIADEEEIPF